MSAFAGAPASAVVRFRRCCGRNCDVTILKLIGSGFGIPGGWGPDGVTGSECQGM